MREDVSGKRNPTEGPASRSFGWFSMPPGFGPVRSSFCFRQPAIRKSHDAAAAGGDHRIMGDQYKALSKNS